MTESITTPSSMTIGIDLGDRKSHVCALDTDGAVIEESRIATTPKSLRARFEGQAPPRAHQITYHGVLAPAAEWRDLIVPTAPSPGRAPSAFTSRYTSWAELLKRVFAIDALVCPHCGGKRKLISLIRDGVVARKILEHLGLDADPPRLAPARSPPELAFA